MFAQTFLITGSADVTDLTAFAFDVCDQYGVSTVVATDDTDVSRYAALVVEGPSLADPAAKVGTSLIMEALAELHDVPVILPQPLRDREACEGCDQTQTIRTVRDDEGVVFCRDCRGEAAGCFHCFADEPTEPVYVDGAWVPFCGGCAKIKRALHPSEWNGMEDVREPDAMILFGVAV
ncbi:hypothetical protein ACIQIG_17855 [Streptomyces bacillaris]|uniref:hypothetical protein n=1 Tax=Streptomyces bacillaris TaxID=68179 RepID=UPI0034609C32